MELRDGIGSAFFQAGALSVVWLDFSIVTIQIDGSPVTSLGDYRPAYCFLMNEKIGILELINDFSSTEWIIDQNGNVVANNIFEWFQNNPSNRDIFSLILRQIYLQFFNNNIPSSIEILQRFSRISAMMQSRVIEAIGSNAIESYKELSLSEIIDNADDTGNFLDLYIVSKELIGLDSYDLLNIFRKKHRKTNELENPGVFYSKYTLNYCYVLSPVVYAYDISYNEYQDRAILMMSNQFWGDFQSAAVMFVKKNIVVYRDEVQPFILDYWKENACQMFYGYITNYWPVLYHVFCREKYVISSCIVGNMFSHVGHCLINELSGIEKLTLSSAINIIDDVIVHPTNEPIYGFVDVIFPELYGKSIQIDHTNKDFLAMCLFKGVCLFRFTDRYVSRRLANRIIDSLGGTRYYSQARFLSRIAKGINSFICVIGLRLENRTAINMMKFLIHTIEVLITQYGHCTIVFDGHNRTNTLGGRISSNNEELTEQNLVQMEKELVAALSSYYKDNKMTHIISTIDCPISSSIYWATQANCGVAFWGAGLAKSRWIANLPTFIITNASNLENEKDLYIYSSTEFMEDPSICTFGTSKTVRDRSDLPVLIGDPIPKNVDFEVNLEEFEREFRSFLTAIIHQPGAIPC